MMPMRGMKINTSDHRIFEPISLSLVTTLKMNATWRMRMKKMKSNFTEGYLLPLGCMVS